MNIGNLCYLDVKLGHPFKKFSGAPCVLTAKGVGQGQRYVQVRLINGKKTEDTLIMHPGEVHRENRPWMRRHLRAIVNAQKELERIADKMRRFSETLAQ